MLRNINFIKEKSTNKKAIAKKKIIKNSYNKDFNSRQSHKFIEY